MLSTQQRAPASEETTDFFKKSLRKNFNKKTVMAHSTMLDIV